MAGIWLAPTSVHSESRVYKERPDWIARLPDGSPNGTCEHWGPTAYWLNLTLPEAFQYAVNTLRDKRALCEKTPVRVTASGMENVRFLFRDRLLRATVSGRKLSGEQSILISFDKA